MKISRIYTIECLKETLTRGVSSTPVKTKLFQIGVTHCALGREVMPTYVEQYLWDCLSITVVRYYLHITVDLQTVF